MQRTDHDDVARLKRRILDAAGFTEPWEALLAEIVTRIGATSAAAIGVGQGGQRLADASMWWKAPELMREYAQSYLAVCPRMRIGRTMSAGQVFSDLAGRAFGGPVTRDYYDFMDRNNSGLARVVIAERRADLDIGNSFYSRIDAAEAGANLTFWRPLSRNFGWQRS